MPFSVFNFPNLKILSLYRSAITYDSIVAYNLPSNVSINDTEAANDWMESNFRDLNPNETEYWLSRSSICDENITSFPGSFGVFVELACEYPVELSNLSTDTTDADTLCPPHYLGDGTCQGLCSGSELWWDNGMHFSEVLTLEAVKWFICGLD